MNQRNHGYFKNKLLIGGGGVVGGLVGGFVVVLLCVTVVFDISDVTGVIVSLVSDGLSASVGEVDVVGT